MKIPLPAILNARPLPPPPPSPGSTRVRGLNINSFQLTNFSRRICCYRVYIAVDLDTRKRDFLVVINGPRRSETWSIELD